MFRLIANLFRTPTPPEPFVDSSLGEFEFDNDLGWKKLVRIENSNIELVLGSDGEQPNKIMLELARSWIADWPIEKPKLLDYVRREVATWTMEPDPPDAKDLRIRSINVLWPEHPKTCMIYFENPGDDIRLFHLTLDDREPKGFAYDD